MRTQELAKCVVVCRLLEGLTTCLRNLDPPLSKLSIMVTMGLFEVEAIARRYRRPRDDAACEKVVTIYMRNSTRRMRSKPLQHLAIQMTMRVGLAPSPPREGRLHRIISSWTGSTKSRGEWMNSIVGLG